jgi:hypothetical protein
MRKRANFVATIAGSSLGVFGTLWLLLEPAGGFSAIDRTLSRDAANYIALCVVSVVLGIVIVVTRRTRSHGTSSVQTVGSSRLEVDFHRALSDAHQRVIAIGISLPTFTSEAGLSIVKQLVQRGVTVDFVFVNPASPLVLQRPARLYGAFQQPAAVAAASLRACLHFRQGLSEDDAVRFRVHLTNALPACAAVIVDDSCYWHPYLSEYTGVRSPYLHDDASNGFGQYVLKHASNVMSDYSFQPTDCEWGTLAQRFEQDASARTEFTAAETRAIRRSLR